MRNRPARPRRSSHRARRGRGGMQSSLRRPRRGSRAQTVTHSHGLVEGGARRAGRSGGGPSTAACSHARLADAARRERARSKRHGGSARQRDGRSPRVARSPPAETKPGPSTRASASSTARPLTTPFRSRRSPGGRRTRSPESVISRQRPAGTGAEADGASMRSRLRS